MYVLFYELQIIHFWARQDVEPRRNSTFVQNQEFPTNQMFSTFLADIDSQIQ